MRFILSTGVAMTALGIGTGAFALTAEEAWQALTTGSSAEGAPIAVESANYAGGVLTLTGLSYSVEGDDFSLQGSIGEAILTEQSDGSVDIAFSNDYVLNFDTLTDEGEDVDGVITVDMGDSEITASGTPGSVSMAYTAGTVGFEMTELVIDGTPVDIDATAAMNGITGSYQPGGTEAAPTLNTSLLVSSVVVDVSAQEPGGPGSFVAKVESSNINQTSSGSGSPVFQMDRLPELLASGFQNTGSVTYGPTAVALAVTGAPEEFSMNLTMEGGTTSAQVSQGQMVYNGSLAGMDVALSGSEIPFPQVTGGIGSLSNTLRLPLQQSETEQPFVLSLALAGVTVGEEIWNLFDPAGQLPRDPAALTLNLGGQGRWIVDLFDEAAMEQSEMPAEVSALNLSELLFSALGAKLTGTGGFTFDYANLDPEGFPNASGVVNLELTGANGLVDTLVNMGLLPQEQAMMARMFAGMLALPGEGPDSLVSEIELMPDGRILANGSPLPFQ